MTGTGEARSNYIAACEDLYQAWREGGAARDPFLATHFTLEHCPEPYLSFGPQDRPLVFLSTNPGGGLPQQLRPEQSAQSLLRGCDSYGGAAARLGQFYRAPETRLGSAKRNIAAMCSIAQALGYSGVQQVEAIPWHSPSLPNKREVVQSLRARAPSHVRYDRALRAYLRELPMVLSWSAGTPARRGGDGVAFKADLLGLDLEHCQTLWLSEGRQSQALLWRRSEGSVRGIFVTQGNAILPSLSSDGGRRAGSLRAALGASSDPKSIRTPPASATPPVALHSDEPVRSDWARWARWVRRAVSPPKTVRAAQGWSAVVAWALFGLWAFAVLSAAAVALLVLFVGDELRRHSRRKQARVRTGS